MAHSTQTAFREGQRFLTWLFEGVAPLAAAHTNSHAGSVRLRPEGAMPGRSAFLMTVTTERNGAQSYTINSNGIAQWKMQGIVDAVSDALGTTPVRNEAINEMGQSLDMADTRTAKDMGRWQVEYPDGTSLSWTAVSGITLHCPSAAAFTTLAQAFSGTEKGQTP